MSNPIIVTQNLTKFYGRDEGVVDLNLEVQEGEIFEYLGPNGAGKTTTIRLLLDFIRPTRGNAQIFGMDIRQRSLEIRKHVGYLPGELELYGNLTGKEFLVYMANLRGGVHWEFVGELTKRLN